MSAPRTSASRMQTSHKIDRVKCDPNRTETAVTEVAFCFWRVRRNSAVELALLRLMRLFKACGATTHVVFHGSMTAATFWAQWRQLRSGRTIICADIWQVAIIRMLLLGSKSTLVFWVQGLVAEESYLKRGSEVRRVLLRVFEAISFAASDAYVFVSDSMRSFYARRYRYTTQRPILVVPCISDLEIDMEVSRRSSSFCYLGGMAKWQKFDDVIRVMNKVIASNPEATFNIATRELHLCDVALTTGASPALLRATSVCSLSDKDEVERFLSAQEFGFLLRDDNSVNAVSSPIKLAEYLSCGVNVIGTKAVTSYASLLSDAGHVLDIASYLDASTPSPKFLYKGPQAALRIHREHFSAAAASPNVMRFLAGLGAPN